MKLSIIGSSAIIYHHLMAAKKNFFSIDGIYSSNKKSKQIKKYFKEFKIKKIYNNWKELIINSKKNNGSVLIAGKIKDNDKFLKYCLKNKLKVLIEKPIFLKSEQFNDYLKFKNKIFVGYNRIFYRNISKLKREIKLDILKNIIIKCPELNKKNILLNTCHIISILYYLFGKIFLIKKIKKKGFILCLLKTKKNIPIFLSINFGSADNFSLEFNFKNKRINLCPIENMNYFKKVKKINFKNNNIYVPIIQKNLNEYKYSKLKPGFENQYANFRKFIKNEKNLHLNIVDAKNIMKICSNIAN